MLPGALWLLPLTLIVVTLTVLNLERIVFDFMGGIREKTASAGSYDVLLSLSLIAIVLFFPLLFSYAVLILQRLEAAGRKTQERAKTEN